MDITLVIHLEVAEDPQPKFVWWADSEDLPGFSSAADHLQELLKLSREAIDEMALGKVNIRYAWAPPENQAKGAFDAPEPASDPALDPHWSASGIAIAVRVAA